jgi:hypothetical protein
MSASHAGKQYRELLGKREPPLTCGGGVSPEAEKKQRRNGKWKVLHWRIQKWKP